MPDPGPLGDFLRSRRARRTPQDAGLTTGARRQVTGLRREEVATLAGLSFEYYRRLERGQDRNPSRQVLDAIARALGLDAVSRAHLHRLVANQHRLVTADFVEVPADVLALLEVVALPAFVQNSRFDVLAVNAAAAALSPSYRVGANRLRSMLIDPAERRQRPELEAELAQMVAGLRRSLVGAEDRPVVQALVEELSEASGTFTRLWEAHDVLELDAATTTIDHAALGTLRLYRRILPLIGTAGLTLVVHFAAPGTREAAVLSSLGQASTPPLA